MSLRQGAALGPSRNRRLHLPAALTGLLIALVVLAPLLVRRGFVLTGDMVFVPRWGWSDWIWGLEGGAARQVPSDAVVAALSTVIPGDLVQDGILVALVACAAWGAALLAAGVADSRVPCVAAALAYAWSPFLYERLILGQWALLLGWAALPWVVRLAPRAGWPAVTALALGSLGGPSAWLLVTGVALAVAGFADLPARLVRVARLAGAAVVLSLPWLIPSLVRQGLEGGDPAGVAAFAARADTALGTLASLVAGGGVWNAWAAPPGRDSLVVAVLTLVLFAAVVTGLLAVARSRSRPAWWTGLWVISVSGVAVAWVGTVPWGQDLYRGLTEQLGAAGLVRDGQKFVAPWTLLVAIGVAACANRLAAAEHPTVRLAGPTLLAFLPVAILPGLSLAALGRLASVEYPPGWTQAAQVVASRPGPVLVLPWQAYRAFGWNRGHPSLDPTRRWLSSEVLGSDTLVVDGVEVKGEDPRAAALEPFAGSQTELVAAARRMGARWVLVQADTPGQEPIPAGPRAVDTPDIVLVEVQPAGEGAEPAVPRVVLALGWGAAALVLVVAVASTFVHRTRDSLVESSRSDEGKG